MPDRSRITDLHTEPHGGERPDREKNAQRKPSDFHIFMTESGKKNQKLVEAAFEKIEETAFSGISEEEQKRFMQTFEKIYKNLNAK